MYLSEDASLNVTYCYSITAVKLKQFNFVVTGLKSMRCGMLKYSNVILCTHEYIIQNLVPYWVHALTYNF